MSEMFSSILYMMAWNYGPKWLSLYYMSSKQTISKAVDLHDLRTSDFCTLDLVLQTGAGGHLIILRGAYLPAMLREVRMIRDVVILIRRY